MKSIGSVNDEASSQETKVHDLFSNNKKYFLIPSPFLAPISLITYVSSEDMLWNLSALFK